MYHFSALDFTVYRPALPRRNNSSSFSNYTREQIDAWIRDLVSFAIHGPRFPYLNQKESIIIKKKERLLVLILGFFSRDNLIQGARYYT